VKSAATADDKTLPCQLKKILEQDSYDVRCHFFSDNFSATTFNFRASSAALLRRKHSVELSSAVSKSNLKHRSSFAFLNQPDAAFLMPKL